LQVEKWHDAVRVALRLNSMERVHKAFATCEDPLDKQQLAYLLARHNVVLDCEDGPSAIADEDLREKVRSGSCFFCSSNYVFLCVLYQK
jgi:26S proteasome regulatory subunit N1